MTWQKLKSEPCSIARTLSVLGERWTILILRECFRGQTRFDAFSTSLGIPRAVLTERLKTLVKQSILEKRQSPDHAGRFDYILTEKGWDLRPVLLTMLVWGDKYLADDFPPMRVTHLSCGHQIQPELYCPSCTQKINPKEIKVETAKNAFLSS